MLYLHHWRLNWTHEWRSPAASERAAPMFKLAGRNRPEAEISPQTSRSRLYLPVIRTRGPGHFAYLGHENGRLWCSRPSVRWSVIDTPSRQFSSTFQILIWKLCEYEEKRNFWLRILPIRQNYDLMLHFGEMSDLNRKIEKFVFVKNVFLLKSEMQLILVVKIYCILVLNFRITVLRYKLNKLKYLKENLRKICIIL